jgi:hypothetical protein
MGMGGLFHYIGPSVCLFTIPGINYKNFFAVLDA